MKFCAAALIALLPCLAAAVDQDRGKQIGSPSAPVRMELYSDFQCPHCRVFHEAVLPELLKDYIVPGKVLLISHEFPLPMHQHAREAADYATAAARIGKYQEVSSALFLSQDAWANNGKVWDAVASALTPAEQKKVQALVKESSVLSEVQSDLQGGTMAGVNETPTLIIFSGSKRYSFPGPTPGNYSLLRSLIDGLVR
ncbi:MAG TPA: thioredoxin domain-containing protein [Bryobacteraceae bacterium]|nr:thioredoxin domain-containing protein [Bryobacteraceae bacterium]